MLYRALEAAKTLQEKYNVSAEVIDARSIVPFDYSKVIESVKKTGRYRDRGRRLRARLGYEGHGSEHHRAGVRLPRRAAGGRWGSRNWITPAHELEEFFFPYPVEIIDCIHEKLLPIDGYVPTHDLGDLEKLERSRRGV